MGYLYYLLYKHLSTVKSNNLPAYNAMLLLMIAQAMNIASICIIINYTIFPSFYNSSNNYKLENIKEQGLIFGLLLLILNYIFLFKRRDYIFKKYENTSKIKISVGYIILFVYMVGSLIITYILGTTLMPK